MDIAEAYPLIIGKIDMRLEEFYDGVSFPDNQEKYALCPLFYGALKKYPPTNPRLVPVRENGKIYYIIKGVDAAVSKKQLLASKDMQKIWLRAYQTEEISDKEQLLKKDVYKLKFLLPDLTFSKRLLPDERLETRLKDLSDRLYIDKTFYKFIYYTYACFIETKDDIKNYREFQDYYGKYIYAVTAEHNGKQLGLTWLDFICHEPDAHLELGLICPDGADRYQDFDTWKKGDTMRITIMADGFKDIVFSFPLKKHAPSSWTSFWYKKMMKKTEDKK